MKLRGFQKLLKKNMNNSRVLIVLVFIFLFFTAIIIKLFDIQIVKSEELKYYAQRQQTKMEKIEADRGLIYDRDNMTFLCYTHKKQRKRTPH